MIIDHETQKEVKPPNRLNTKYVNHNTIHISVNEPKTDTNGFNLVMFLICIVIAVLAYIGLGMQS